MKRYIIEIKDYGTNEVLYRKRVFARRACRREVLVLADKLSKKVMLDEECQAVEAQVIKCL